MQNILLVVLSCVFIVWASVKFLLIALVMTLLNYFGALLIDLEKFQNKKIRQVFYYGLLILDVLILGFYKYFPEFASSHSVALFNGFVFSTLVFPLGISFYTFSLIRYIVDVFSKEIRSEKNPVNFSLFVLFFPKFISGPIERYKKFEEQLSSRVFSIQQVYEGVIRFVIGLNKKILLVSVLEKMSAMVFSLDSKEWSSSFLWAGIFLFGLQLYLDFDAYMDMAIGLGKILGFELSENFNLPYLSKSIQEFWNRWHITLSKWLQDTLLFPFQFKTRRKQPKSLFAILGILITFLVSGLWHGNSWNFVLWGLWHGVWLCLEMLFLKKWLSKLPGIFQQIYALLIVNLGWVFFRLDSLKDIGRYFSVLFIPQTYGGILQHRLIEFTRIDMLIVLGVGILVSFGVFKKYSAWMVNKSWLFEVGYVALLFVLLGFSYFSF
jgi:alginate O-acetyltransferase complex protein AlgI